jgi:hypothetical protein
MSLTERDAIMACMKSREITIPKKPVRSRIHGVQTFNAVRGGEYLFMPRLSALKWLAEH